MPDQLHRNYEGRLENLIEILADLALKKLDPTEKAESMGKSKTGSPKHKTQKSSIEAQVDAELSQPTSTSNLDPFPALETQKQASSRSRYIPTSVKSTVWLRSASDF